MVCVGEVVLAGLQKCVVPSLSSESNLQKCVVMALSLESSLPKCVVTVVGLLVLFRERGGMQFGVLTIPLMVLASIFLTATSGMLLVYSRAAAKCFFHSWIWPSLSSALQ